MTTTRCAVSVRSLPWGATDMPVAPPNTAAPRRALHGARCRPASLLLLARRWTHRAQRSPFRAAPRCEQASPTYGATLATKGKTWTWRGHKINYVREGQGPAIVLLHGFGVSARATAARHSGDALTDLGGFVALLGPLYSGLGVHAGV
jgi:hypothetical protein